MSAARMPRQVLSAAGVRSAADSIDLSVEIVGSIEGLRALKPDYERLNRLTDNSLPFALHEWHLSWCRHFLNASPHIHDEPAIHVVRTGAGDCVAIVPLIRSRRRVGPLVVATLEMLGADPAITEIRLPLLAPGYEIDAAWLIQRRLAAESDWDWIHWSGIGGPFGEALAVGGQLKWQEPVPFYVLDLPATWEELRTGLKRNIRESLRHCYNSLKRDGLSFELVTARAPDEVSAAIERFLALHALRATVPGTVPHPNHFTSSVARRFLHEVCGELAARGRVRVFELRIGDELVATRIGFVVGGTLYLYYSGFDPRWGKYSVMTTTMAEALKQAMAEGLTRVNLSTGTDTSKTRWGPRELILRHACQTSGRWRSRAARVLYERSRRAGMLPRWLRGPLQQARRDWT